MKYYRLSLSDYPQSSWVLHEIIENLPKREKTDSLPPVVHQFFPDPDAKVQMKPQYRPLCCKACGRYETDRIFQLGFGEPVTVRLKQDLGYTHDRILILNDKALKVLQDAKVQGYESKPIGKTGWNALRVTLLVDVVPGAIKLSGPPCPECGAPDEAGAAIYHEDELSPPNRANTFFAPKTACTTLLFRDRDTFFTEDVLKALKAGKIKGPYCDRLWTGEEFRKHEESLRRGGPIWTPSGVTVYLNGK